MLILDKHYLAQVSSSLCFLRKRSAKSDGKKMSEGINYADKSTNGPDILKQGVR